MDYFFRALFEAISPSRKPLFAKNGILHKCVARFVSEASCALCCHGISQVRAAWCACVLRNVATRPCLIDVSIRRLLALFRPRAKCQSQSSLWWNTSPGLAFRYRIVRENQLTLCRSPPPPGHPHRHIKLVVCAFSSPVSPALFTDRLSVVLSARLHLELSVFCTTNLTSHP